MQEFDLYRDIAMRTNGDIYIGVVGPVRTGKSTFISKFMQTLVVPTIKDINRKQRIIDELPQSADGKTIMTTQPKFVPDKAQAVELGDNLSVKVRLVDCVGYLIDDAVGYLENDSPRLVDTPWSDEKMPFDKAAEYGTYKVIKEHSTIGIVVTNDGSVAGIPRSSYLEAERKIVDDMKDCGKPFVIVLNTKNPNDNDTKRLAVKLSENYGVPVVVQDVANMTKENISHILKEVLLQFPVKQIGVKMPKWMQALPSDNKIVVDIVQRIKEVAQNIKVVGEYNVAENAFENDEYVKKVANVNVDFGSGKISVEICPIDNLFYSVLSEQCDLQINNDFELVSYIKSLGYAKKQYDKLSAALNDADEYGYGVVTPSIDDMVLDDPKIVKRGGRYGVKMRASAPSYHIMKVDVETEVNPLMGDSQDEQLIKNWIDGFGDNLEEVWKTNMLGKSLDEIAQEGLVGKLVAMPSDARGKLKKTVGRIVNEGKGGVLCILL